MADERDLRLQISEERREQDAANAKRDERVSVLEAKFDSVRASNKLMVATFATLTVTVIGAAGAIILSFGSGG